jgi:hypothetical protein
LDVRLDFFKMPVVFGAEFVGLIPDLLDLIAQLLSSLNLPLDLFFLKVSLGPDVLNDLLQILVSFDLGLLFRYDQVFLVALNFQFVILCHEFSQLSLHFLLFIDQLFPFRKLLREFFLVLLQRVLICVVEFFPGNLQVLIILPEIIDLTAIFSEVLELKIELIDVPVHLGELLPQVSDF